MSTMMSIGEFARRTGMSASAIRFYGDRGLLLPAEIDPSSGYRRYRVDQIADAIRIRDLRRINTPLADIERSIVLPEPGHHQAVLDQIERLERDVQRAHDIADSLGIIRPTQEHTMSTHNSNPTNADTTDTIQTTTLSARDLADALEQVLPAAGTDARLPHLMCVLIESKEGSIRLAATDSHRLAIRDIQPIESSTDFAATVAAAAVADWPAMLDSPMPVTLTLDGRQINVRGDGVDFEGRAIPSEFPDYEPVLTPSREQASAIVDRSDLTDALAHFDSTAGAVLFSTTPSGLRLTRRETRVDISARCTSADVHVGLDAAYVSDAIQQAVGPEVIIEIEDPMQPVVFRSADDGTYACLIMPVKLD